MLETIILISLKKRECQGSEGIVRHAFANKTNWHLCIVGCWTSCCYFENSLSGPNCSASNISLNCPSSGQDQETHFSNLNCHWQPPRILVLKLLSICECSVIISLQILWLIVIFHTTKCFNEEEGSALCFGECPWGEDFNFCMMEETFKSYCISYHLSDKMCS